MKTLRNKLILFLTILNLIVYCQKIETQKVIKNTDLPLIMKMDIPKADKKIQSFFEKYCENENKEWKDWMVESNNYSRYIPLEIIYKFDTIYQSEKIFTIVYDVYENNIPTSPKQHLVKLFYFDINYNKIDITANEILGINKKKFLPLYKFINDKIEDDCKLIFKSIELEELIPLKNDNFIIIVWDDVINTREIMCQFETLKIEYTKKELMEIIKKLP